MARLRRDPGGHRPRGVELSYTPGARVVAVYKRIKEVHPYTRVLGFTVAGPERICERVSVPSVLLWLELERLHERLLSADSSAFAAAMGTEFVDTPSR